MYSMRRKTLEEDKAGIIDFDAEIAMARELELTAKSGLLAEPDASSSSGSDSETPVTGEETEGEDVEGPTDEG